MKKNINMRMYSGSINKDLMVNYCYTYIPNGEPDNKFPTFKTTAKGTKIIDHTFGLAISEGFNMSRLFIPGRIWHSFVSLLDKTIKAITESLYEIFPDINKSEFEVDSRVLERFQTEKACSTAGMSMTPGVWVDKSSQCYPAIRISTPFDGILVIPLEDAIPLSKILNNIDPLLYGLQLLNIFGITE